MAATAATATRPRSRTSDRPAARPSARAPSGSKATADQVRHHGREDQVAGAEAEQRAEQEPVDGGAGFEDVARQDHAGGEGGHEQQRCALPVLASGTTRSLNAARVAERDGEAGQGRAHPRRVGDDQAGKARRAGGVGEEREPAKHDPCAEDATGQREQQELEQRFAKEGELRQVQG